MSLVLSKRQQHILPGHPQESPASRSIEACFDDFVRQFFRARKHHLVAAIHFKKLEISKAWVFITGRRDLELATAVKEIGHDVTGVRGDVSNLSDLDRLFERGRGQRSR
jgi:hypothetical protein